jgi:hypothetical protein
MLLVERSSPASVAMEGRLGVAGCGFAFCKVQYLLYYVLKNDPTVVSRGKATVVDHTLGMVAIECGRSWNNDDVILHYI